MAFPKTVKFGDLELEVREPWEEEYLETGRCRIEKTLEIIQAKPGDKVLEIGCDSGLFALIFKDRFKVTNYRAVEVSRERLATAKERGMDVLEVDVAKEKLPFESDFFDLVIFTEVLEHLADPLPALAEIKRVVKSNGRVIISTPNSVGLFARYNHLLGVPPHNPVFLDDEKSRKGKYGAHRFELTFNQAKELLEKSGFRVEQTVFSRFNHQRRGLIVKIIERLSLSKSTRSDMMIFKCRVLK